MPLVSPTLRDPFTDARQSERALTIRTGVERYFHEQGYVTLAEVTLDGGRRADLVALSPKSDIAIVEIKSSVADLRADTKWPDYRAHCDRLFFATLEDVPQEIFPEDAGFVLADRYGADILRPAPPHPLTPAARRKLLLRFARHAARRLSRLTAHAGVDPSALADDHDGENVGPLMMTG